jgi:glycerol-3-phosphate dehydrogenase
MVETKAVINAGGPFVDRIAKLALGAGTPAHLRLVKGSHIVVRRAYPGEHAYIFQQTDGRIVFAIPYERDFTLIGTTDMLFEGNLDLVAITPEETAYLREAASLYFRSPVAEDEIVHTFAGVRPLYEDKSRRNSAVTRDYVFELDTQGGAPILSIYGGKLTTFRKLAEHALERLGQVMEIPGEPWTAGAALPGGRLGSDFAGFLWQAHERWPWVPPEMLQRLCRAYGSRVEDVLGEAHGLSDLGHHFGGTLYEAELRYLAAKEYACTGDDVLWRRSKLGLHLSEGAAAQVTAWMEQRARETADFA